MCLCDEGACNRSEENGEIDRSLLKCFLLLRTVVPAICNMGERVLPTVWALSEVAKCKRKEQGVEPNDP